MAKISIHVFDDDYFRFRRWLKARDPSAAVSVEPGVDGLWVVTAETGKAYLLPVIARRWQAA